MNVSIITGNDGVLTVHRESCKKIGDRETQSVDEVLDTNPGALTTAKKASCCKPLDSVMEEVEQAGWDALEAAANAAVVEGQEAQEDLTITPDEDEDGDEDLIGSTDEDLIGAPAEPAKPKPGKAAAKVAAAKTEAKELNGLDALKKVAAHLGISLGKNPVFPGFGKAFKTADKQSLYINSKGNADVRAKDAEQADEWADLDHIERRSGNYVRVALSAL